uniref:CYCLIN domain-containing protein n=1 Tax=Elaeophora elaphi TaxID=1147741 RepID=A0A0R3RR63_9BILA
MLLDRSYVDLKNQVIKAERKLLNALGFVVHVNHPHKLIYAYLHALGATGNHELMQKAWSYMNDGLRTDIFLRYRPETIACACIHLAARTITEPLPLPREPFPWFEAFDASDRDVQTISLLLLQVYARIREFTKVTQCQAPNWTRLNDTLNKLRIGLSNAFAKAQQAESMANKEVERAKAILEKRRREIASKAAEMERQNGARRSGKEKEVQRDREKENDHYNAKQTSSSTSRSRSRSPVEPKKFRSSPVYYHHRAESGERDRPSKRNHHHSRHQRDERRRAREERRAEKDRRHRTRSRDSRRKVVEKDRVSNQREREKDVYLALGKRRKSTDSPSPVKVRR